MFHDHYSLQTIILVLQNENCLYYTMGTYKIIDGRRIQYKLQKATLK